MRSVKKPVVLHEIVVVHQPDQDHAIIPSVRGAPSTVNATAFITVDPHERLHDRSPHEFFPDVPDVQIFLR